MSTALTMSAYYNSDFNRDRAWQDVGTHRYENEEITLPSIQQAVPEVLIPVHRDNARRAESSVVSPRNGRGFEVPTPPEYVHSPNQSKRRRLSLEGEMGVERTGQVPRLYGAPPQHDHPPHSPVRAGMPSESWGASNRANPYAAGSPSIRPMHANGGHDRAEQRLTLPSLPFPMLERDHGEVQRMRGHPGGEYQREPFGRPSPSHNTSYRPEPGASAYRPVDPGYDYYPPARNHSLSVGSARPYDRPPFSAGPYGHSYPEQYLPVQIGELGIGGPADNRHRKRRGNLPKETTDKLRNWFTAHLDHPYPTEDEKQELMRDTGLQMNQISNWFINARRRQLPTLQRNARAESYALSGRNGDSGGGGSVLVSRESDSVPLSDGETNNYDDADLGHLSRRRGAGNKRGSI